MSKPKCSCLHCHIEVSVCNINKHYHSNGCLSKTTKLPKLTNCKYCNLDFSPLNTSEKRNHLRWCELNPKSEEYRKTNRLISLKAMNQHPARIKANASIKKAHAAGKYNYLEIAQKQLATKITNGTLKHTKLGLENCKIAANNAHHQRKCRNSHQFIDKHNRTFIFDSSWEDTLAIRLDKLDINWIRPQPITWIDDLGVAHKYFADFYLPDFDLYIDPKNLYIQNRQSEKIKILKNQINLLILSSKEECLSFSI